MEHYDRDGRKLTMVEWGTLFNDPDYCRIGYDEINGRLISTVWLGLDHNYFGGGQPVIFETLIEEDGEECAMLRYHTEDEAREGHEQACAEARARVYLIKEDEHIDDPT